MLLAFAESVSNLISLNMKGAALRAKGSTAYSLGRGA